MWYNISVTRNEDILFRSDDRKRTGYHMRILVFGSWGVDPVQKQQQTNLLLMVDLELSWKVYHLA